LVRKNRQFFNDSQNQSTDAHVSAWAVLAWLSGVWRYLPLRLVQFRAFFMEEKNNKSQTNFTDLIDQEQLHYRLENSVDKRLWESFDLNDSKFLLKILESKEVIIDYEKLNKPKFQAKKDLLDRFIELGLIHGIENPNNSSHQFKFSSRLIPQVKAHIKTIKEESSKSIPKDWSRISFKLLRNKKKGDKNTPLFSGTVEFKQDIIIKAGTKCLYGIWSREDENQWLTITPVADIIVAKNKSVEYEAEPIRTILNRFLNNQEFIE